MSCTTHYRSTLATVASQPQELTPYTATAAVDAGQARYNELEFRQYVHWPLQYARPEAREAIRTAYLTIQERMEA